MKLEDWRNEIDRIDAEIVELLNQRANIAIKIGRLKCTAGLPVTDGAREDEILRKVVAKNRGALRSEAVAGIFRRIIRESRDLQIETNRRQAGGKRIL